MPASLQQRCQHPAIRQEDARKIIARYIGALRTCDGKRADAIQFYDDLREGLK